MSAELQYTVDDLGDVTFPQTGHRYRVRPFPRGNPAVALFDTAGAQLAVDRSDPFDAKARARFAAQADRPGHAETIQRELSVVARLLAEEPAAGPPPPEPDGAVPYDATKAGLVWHRPVQGGTVPVPLANFAATIVADLVRDDGVETQRVFEVEARLGSRVRRFSVPVERFPGMAWPVAELGAGALIYPGAATRDHARAAVQLLSGEVPERRVYAHLGWREVDGAWVYLHAGGAIGADGAVPGIAVDVPDALARYTLPGPPAGPALADAIRASLGMLGVLPDPVGVPAFAAVWRAALGGPDFSLHAEGATGEGKTELLALAQQHWGPGLDARHVPGSWSSTGNALEGAAFVAKDALFGIDDFVAAGSATDAARLHRDADRLFRAQGNGSARMRMRAGPTGLTLQPPKPPRGLIFSTGEDIPRGQSLRGRVAILSVGRGDCDWAALTRCQADAAAGLYAAAMAGFVRHLAGDRLGHLATFGAAVAKHRQAAVAGGGHRRTPGIVANLAAALETFLAFALEVGALTVDEAAALSGRGWAALGAMAAAQPGFQLEQEPTWLVRTLLASAVASGEAHLAAADGGEPPLPAARGWRPAVVGTGDHERAEWRPQGKRVGWVAREGDGERLYLDPVAALAVAQELGRKSGDALTTTPGVLRKRLREHGLLAAVDAARGTLTVRRAIEGTQRAVLAVVAGFLDPSPETKPDIPDSANPESPPKNGSDAQTVGNVGFSRAPSPGAEPTTGASDEAGQRSFGDACLGCGAVLRGDRAFYCSACEREVWGRGGTR